MQEGKVSRSINPSASQTVRVELFGQRTLIMISGVASYPDLNSGHYVNSGAFGDDRAAIVLLRGWLYEYEDVADARAIRINAAIDGMPTVISLGVEQKFVYTSPDGKRKEQGLGVPISAIATVSAVVGSHRWALDLSPASIGDSRRVTGIMEIEEVAPYFVI